MFFNKNENEMNEIRMYIIGKGQTVLNTHRISFGVCMHKVLIYNNYMNNRHLAQALIDCLFYTRNS